MKRFISFIMSLVIMCGLFFNPYLKLDARAAYELYGGEWHTEVIGGVQLDAAGAVSSSKTVGLHITDIDLQFDDDVRTAFTKVIEAINTEAIKEDSTKLNTHNESTLQDDTINMILSTVLSARGINGAADAKIFSVLVAAGVNTASVNELAFDIIINYFDPADTSAIKGFRVFGWMATDISDLYLLMTSSDSPINKFESLPSALWEGNKDISDMDGGTTALEYGYSMSYEFVLEPVQLLESLLNGYKDVINTAIETPKAPTVDILNLYFDISLGDSENSEGQETGSGARTRTFNISASNEYTGHKNEPLGQIKVKLAEMENDSYGNPETMPDTDPALKDIAGLLTGYYTTYENAFSVERRDAEHDTIVGFDDFIWDYIAVLDGASFPTNIADNADPTAEFVKLPILNDFKVFEYILKSSLIYSKDKTNSGPWITPNPVKVTSDSSSDFYTYTVGDVNGKTSIIEVKKNDTDVITFDGLTPYQKNSLKATYNNLIAQVEGLNTAGLISELTDTSVSPWYDETSGDLTTSIVDEDMIREAVEEFETSPYARSSEGVIDIARLSSVLTKYVTYHAVHTNFNITPTESSTGGSASGSGGSTNGIVDSMPDGTYSVVLHSLMNDWAVFQDAHTEIDTGALSVEDYEKHGKTFLFVDMPSQVDAIEAHNNLITDAMNEDKAFTAIQLLLQAISYIFEALDEGGYGTQSQYTAEDLNFILSNPDAAVGADYDGLADLLEFINQCRDGDQYSATLAAEATLSDTTNIWIFRCIIELYDTVQLLGINPYTWSDTIAAYYQLYVDNEKAFDAMRSAPVLFGRGYTGGATVDNPLGVFYSVQGREMSDKWNIGFSNSALYVPMVTNVYDATIYEFANSKDQEWISEFMYKYGFHRKALYISTDPNIVVNNALNKSSDNGMVVATLKDLLNYDRDIQLYIDTSFYNAGHVEDAISRVDYATLYQYTHDQDININVADEAAKESIEAAAGGASITYYNDDNNNFIDETLNIDTKTLLKDDDIVSYSPDVARSVTHLGETAMDTESLYDGYILSAEALTGDDNIFSQYNYTPILSYAVVSAIYRDIDLYNELSAVSKSTRVVFESSRNILFAEGTNNNNWISYMNYIQLSNLEKQMNVNVETQLDLESPIFIDIFGNIVTESGFVIIPAASNATLCDDQWTPYTVGFGTYMSAGGDEIMASDLPDDVFEWLTAISISTETEEGEEEDEFDTLNLDTMGAGTEGGWFVYTRDGELQLKNTYLESWGLTALVNWSTLNANSDIIQQVFWNNAYFNKAIKMYNNKTINMVTEVLRGAPIENIDYVEEGISGTRSGEAGIVIAYALDELLNTLTSDDSNFTNSMTTMPNLAFMEYLEYVIYFGIKIVLALFILVFLIFLFKAGIKNRIGIKEVFKLALTVIIVISAIYILPNSITWSYDAANASMLSDEAEEILLYSSMRQAEGQQIGITEVSKIDENTQLLVKVDEVNPSWSKILGTALLSNEYNSFTDLFTDELQNTPYYNMNGVVTKGADVYLDIQTIMDSTSIAYNGTSNTLYNKNVIRDEQYVSMPTGNYSSPDGDTYTDDGYTGTTVGEGVQAGMYLDESGESQPGDGYIKQDYYAVYSFTSPYYVMLDQLIANINEYNQTHNIQTYTATIDAKGNVMTYDVAAPYLTSDEFMVEGYDILGLTDALMCERQLTKFAYIFDEEDKANIKESAWYPADLDEETKQQRIANVYDYARAFVSKHHAVIKHIPDEMLIKVLAFACAIEYNKEFHCEFGDAISLITVDNRDLMRFMLSDFKGVYSNVAYSFGRYVYNTSGTIGVILSAILSCVILLTTVLKPLLIWVLFFIIIINIMFRQMLFDKPNEGVEGYFIGCGLFMAVNFVYSALIKLCFIVADSDLSAIAAMLLCIVVQVLYLLIMGWMIYTQIKDWRAGGFNKFAPAVYAIGDTFRRLRGPRYSYSRFGGPRRHAPYSPYPYNGYGNRGYDYGYDNGGYTPHEPMPVYMDERGRRRRRNRTAYNGPLSLDEMRRRDEERESAPYQR